MSRETLRSKIIDSSSTTRNYKRRVIDLKAGGPSRNTKVRGNMSIISKAHLQRVLLSECMTKPKEPVRQSFHNCAIDLEADRFASYIKLVEDEESLPIKRQTPISPTTYRNQWSILSCLQSFDSKDYKSKKLSLGRYSKKLTDMEQTKEALPRFSSFFQLADYELKASKASFSPSQISWVSP